MSAMRPYDFGPGPVLRLAPWAFAVGIAGVVLGAPAPVALALGLLALHRLRGSNASGRPWAVAAVVLGAVGIIELVVVVELVISWMSATG